MKIIITIKDTDNIIGLKEDIAMRLEGVADIVRIDTADVVPKSEVEKLEQDVTRLVQEKDALIKNYAECMKDYAREIFEEIEKFTYRYLNDDDYSGGDLIYDIAELKKKYIGIKRECHKCRYFVGCEKAVWVGMCDEYEGK